jgi:hypothetical protein
VAAFAAIGAHGVAPAAVWSPRAVVEPSISAGAAAQRLAAWQAVADATMEL